MKNHMNLANKKEEIAAIKMVLASLEYQNISLSKTIRHIVDYCCASYEREGNEEFLRVAIMHIYAYLDMGFVYGEHKDLFDQVFHLLGIRPESIFSTQLLMKKSKKKTSKIEIKSMIPRWSSSKYHTKTRDEVAEDIITKVNHGLEGIYYYHSNQNPNKPEADEVYELVINEIESYLRDVKRSRFYKIYD